MGLFGIGKRSKPRTAVPVMRELPASNEAPAMIPTPKPIEAVSPDALRRQLFAAATAAAKGDEKKFLVLCHRHGRAIFGESAIWSHVPAAFRDSPKLVRWYREGLRAIAGLYSQRLGRPEVVERAKQISD
jgi:hypothetical protein